MKIQLGYVSITKTLDITPSTNVTYTEFSKNHDLEKIKKTIISNLEDLEKLVDYNIKNNIHFYRLTSKLIPLATKEDVLFNYIDDYKDYYQRIGKKIKDHNMRVDVHPDQFTVLNSTRQEVLDNTLSILEYHYQILEALGIENKIIILHVGSSVFGKDASIKRFIKQFKLLPEYLQKTIAIENDDKIYTIQDCLKIHKQIGIPIVLDYHHFLCNNEGEQIENYLNAIFSTWKNKHLNPKMHFSSPKNKTKKEFRSHHDYIDIVTFIEFIKKIKGLPFDLDIMLEAKAKDEALFRLIRQLKYYTDYQFIDETSFHI